MVKNPPANAEDTRDMGFFPGSERSLKCQPTPVFLPRNTMDRGAWQATVYGAAKALNLGPNNNQYPNHTSHSRGSSQPRDQTQVKMEPGTSLETQ